MNPKLKVELIHEIGNLPALAHRKGRQFRKHHH